MTSCASRGPVYPMIPHIATSLESSPLRLHNALRRSKTVTGPWVTLPRAAWARLAHDNQQRLDSETVIRLRGLKDPTDVRDVAEVYLPLAQLLNLYRINHDQ